MSGEPTFARRKKTVSPDQQKTIDLVVKREKQAKNEKAQKMATKMPVPCGYKILIMLPVISEKTQGGLVKATETKQNEEVGSICGFVVALGPDAYKDDRFSEPFCKEGDWIIMRSYTGTRFTIEGEELRLINDDSVEAVVDDPRGIVKV